MTVSQQIVLHMVRDNSVIDKYREQDIFSYKFFTTDYAYLEFVLNRYTTTGSITLGELCIRFPEFPTDYISASEDVEFLVYQLKELYVYNQLYKAVEDGQARFPNDGIQLLGFLEDTIKELRAILPTQSDYDIIAHAKDRYNSYLTRSSDPKAFIPTGFPELDNLLGGWSRTGELATILARMGIGKTWMLIYSCIAAWKAGFRCGFVSIEMGEDDIGYRMDTVISGLSNSALRRGDALNMREYNNYIDNMKDKSGILFRTKKDFAGRITPSGIENWIKQQKLDIVFLDGIGYVEDERKGASNKSEASIITDVSEDLKAVSTDTKCPIIITAQANRGGVEGGGNPQLEHVRGSDGIGINASFVASIAYPDDSHRVITMEVLKCRFARCVGKYTYDWDPDQGYIQSRGEVTTTGGSFYGSSEPWHH